VRNTTFTSEELIGQVLDEKYQIVRKLGQGGMGAVYQATHLGTGRPVALKVITPEFTRNPESVLRFQNEAKAAGCLLHPNIVNVTDFGFAKLDKSRLAYLVMEYLEGGTLNDLLKKKSSLPLRLTIDILEQVCLGMERAHQQGIIHRDLKPDNIWLEPNGRGGYNVKILDFGLAKLRNAQLSNNADNSSDGENANLSNTFSSRSQATQQQNSHTTGKNPAYATLGQSATTTATSATATAASLMVSDPDTTENTSSADPSNKFATPVTSGAYSIEESQQTAQTQAGAILGTPLYMSPEQCRSEKLDWRSDIYSLGIIAYRMLSGRTPFTGNMFALIVQHSQATPPPMREKGSDIPAAIEELILSALAKEPADRPASAIAFATALRVNAENETPLLEQSQILYRQARSTFLILAATFFLPPVLIITALLKFNILSSQIFTLTIALLAFLFINRLHTALVGILVQKMLLNPGQPITFVALPNKFLTILPVMLQTSLASLLFMARGLIKFWRPNRQSAISNCFYPLTITIERLSGKSALQRSAILVNKLRYLTTTIFWQEFLGALIMATVLTFLGTLKVGSGAAIKIAISTAVIITAVALGLRHSQYSIATTLLYFKARQTLGQGLDEQSPQPATLGISAENLTTKMKVSYYHIFMGMLRLTGQQALLALSLAMAAFLLTTVFSTLFVRDNISRAARQGNLKEVKRLLANNVAVDQPDPVDNRTPLFEATLFSHPDVVQVLLEKHPNLEVKDSDQRTPLTIAVIHNYPAIVDMLIRSGANLNTVDDDNRTPLILAAQEGHTEIVKLLVAKGANINAQDMEGQTAFFNAVLHAHLETAKTLLDLGADPTIKNKVGDTALSLATRYERREIEAALKKIMPNQAAK
jgi:serine/threonine protein kinase